jgi:hypothetical protein
MKADHHNKCHFFVSSGFQPPYCHKHEKPWEVKKERRSTLGKDKALREAENRSVNALRGVRFTSALTFPSFFKVCSTQSFFMFVTVGRGGVKF